jgi:hypothetical protein
VYGPRANVGPRVDLHYWTGSGTRMNLEVDLDPRQQQRHRDEHLAAMQMAYDCWDLCDGRTGPNPLTSVASIFASARRPTPQERVGRITGVERVQYYARSDGVVCPVTTGHVPLPADGVLPQAVARQYQGIFTTVVRTLPAGRPVRSRRVSPQRRRFDAFLDTVA